MMSSSAPAAPACVVQLLALLAVVLPSPRAAGSYTSSVTLPKVDEGLSTFLSKPFHTIDRAIAMTRLSLLDVSATTSTANEDLREWMYAQLVAMDVQQDNKGGIDMVYVVSTHTAAHFAPPPSTHACTAVTRCCLDPCAVGACCALGTGL
jgi:hypothetical protein